MAGSERLRLFCALRLPGPVIRELAEWGPRELHTGRLVPAENLHVTLAFLGSRPAGEVAAVSRALSESASGTGALRLRADAYRETRSVGMVVLADEGGRASKLARRLHERLALLGAYTPENRPWLPHITVLRYRVQPRLEPPLPALGDIVPSDAAVFISRLRSDGVQYDVLETVPLGG